MAIFVKFECPDCGIVNVGGSDFANLKGRKCLHCSKEIFDWEISQLTYEFGCPQCEMRLTHVIFESFRRLQIICESKYCPFCGIDIQMVFINNSDKCKVCSTRVECIKLPTVLLWER